ncbi:MAG TPA: hypothetical protein VNA20_17895 [Frankiaceae bacterium]|nr:hypothetical protein [Frankiaceae bacterium]
MSDLPIVIRPDQIRVLGEDRADAFCVVTNPPYVRAFEVAASPRHDRSMVLAYDGTTPFEDFIRERVPERSHVLTILPDCLLHSVPADALGERKLLIMACRSGQTGLDGIAHFLRVGQLTDPREQQAFADSFFARGQATEHLVLVDDDFGTSARFNHLDDQYEWHEQLGEVEWGGQQVYPAGEIACFLVPLKSTDLEDDRRFDVDGRLALRGRLIVQSGPPSFLLADQERIYRRLSTIAESALLVDVSGGVITAVQPADDRCRPAATMLESLFEVDSRFSQIFEFGFAFNRDATPWPGNCAMNEVYGGAHGQLHVGLGMLPHTQYHIDMFLTGTRVHGHDGELLFGGPAGPMARRRAAMCPCLVTV